MSKPIILQLLHSMNVGGAEVLAAGLARRLQDRFHFVFGCLDDLGELGAQLQTEGFSVDLLERGEGLDLKCAKRLKTLIHSQKVDVIHAHQYTPFFYALAAGGVGRRPPVLFTEHGRFHPDLPSWKRMLFNRTLLRKRDRVLAVGESVRRALIDNEGIPRHRTEVIYNGIDLSRFDNQNNVQTRDTVREQLHLEPAAFVAILVGRLDYLKDHCTAIRTAARVVKEAPQFRLILVGEGPERPKIEQEIREQGLTEQVILLGTRHDVPDLLQAADVCFLSSISEGIPLTLIEGMAMGLPVVSTNVGGIPEVVVQEETGLLAESGSDEQLARDLLRLQRDPEQRRRLGGQGQTRARQLFSEVEMHHLYSVLYNGMAGTK